jgi:hypothetical protein
MLTVDLLGGVAYARCWDPECVVLCSKSGLQLKAKHRVGAPPAAVLPSLDDLLAYERATDTRAQAPDDDGAII